MGDVVCVAVALELACCAALRCVALCILWVCVP